MLLAAAEIQRPVLLGQCLLAVPNRSLWQAKKTRKRERAMARRLQEGGPFTPEGRPSPRFVVVVKHLSLRPLRFRFAADECLLRGEYTTRWEHDHCAGGRLVVRLSPYSIRNTRHTRLRSRGEKYPFWLGRRWPFL